MSDVINLIEVAGEERAKSCLVELLENLLERAKDGDLNSLVIAGQYRNGDAARAITLGQNCNYFAIMGLLAHLINSVDIIGATLEKKVS